MAENTDSLLEEYRRIAPQASRFGEVLVDQLTSLLQSAGIAVGVPLEFRVKSWDSISMKLERKALELSTLRDLSDLVGVRIILLFSRDVGRVGELLSKTFLILEAEDTQTRLSEDQFGYRSNHFVVELPKEWLAVPSLSAVGSFKTEIQVRTLAQHIWATASHVLQYKHETSVPLQLRRSIYRASALLETVDLEFERVLDSRDTYVAALDASSTSEPLNVDAIEKVLTEMLPPANKASDEPYADLLPDLVAFDVSTPAKLRQLIAKRMDEAVKRDKAQVEAGLNSIDLLVGDRKRWEAGVFYVHVGLVREMLKLEFGKKWMDYIAAKAVAKTANGKRDRPLWQN
jgi:putative GTP pyrophosphokinase